MTSKTILEAIQRTGHNMQLRGEHNHAIEVLNEFARILQEVEKEEAVDAERQHNKDLGFYGQG